MNYYKQFAAMLGLELGQEFSLIGFEEEVDENTYKITEDGIYYQAIQHDTWWVEPYKTLDSLLMGEVKVLPKPWKPKDGEPYWKWATDVELAQFKRWNGVSTDFACWKLGNCFKTSEEAKTKGKEIMKAIQKEYEEA